MQTNHIYHENCLVTLDRMEDGYLPLTVTSPPYNVDLGNNKHNQDKSYDTHDDNLTHEAYMESMKEIFTKIHQKTQSGGRCIINIGDGKNGRIPTHSDYIQMMSEIGWMPMANIVWNKRNVSGRTAWGSYGSPSAPSLPPPFEYIMVFAKDSYKLPQPENKAELIDITKEENLISVLSSSIDYIYDSEQTYYTKDVPKKEVDDFVESMKQSDLLKVQNFFETMPKLSKTHHFECKKCNYTEDIVIEGLQSFFV